MSRLVDPRLAGTSPIKADSDVRILLHDIRNQLTSAGGIVQMIARNEVRCGSHDSFELAQQLLELSLVKLELLRSAMPCVTTVPDSGGVECGRLISRLCNSFSLLASRHGAQLSCESIATPIHARVDSLALSRAVSTLIVLSIAQSGGKLVEVSLRLAGPSIVIVVRDDASGLRRRIRDAFLALQSGCYGAAADPLHIELRKCKQAAAAASARLRLSEAWSKGVCWELELPVSAITPLPTFAGH